MLAHSRYGDNALREVPAISPSVIRINPNNDAILSISGIFLGTQLGSDNFRSELPELSSRGNKQRNLEEGIARWLKRIRLISVANDLMHCQLRLGMS